MKPIEIFERLKDIEDSINDLMVLRKLADYFLKDKTRYNENARLVAIICKEILRKLGEIHGTNK